MPEAKIAPQLLQTAGTLNLASYPGLKADVYDKEHRFIADPATGGSA